MPISDHLGRIFSQTGQAQLGNKEERLLFVDGSHKYYEKIFIEKYETIKMWVSYS
jgi:hypothetical protein